jgi:hypothetical protein
MTAADNLPRSRSFHIQIALARLAKGRKLLTTTAISVLGTTTLKTIQAQTI